MIVVYCNLVQRRPRPVYRSAVLSTKNWTNRRAFTFWTINRAIFTIKYYRMGSAKNWTNRRVGRLSVERLTGLQCIYLCILERRPCACACAQGGDDRHWLNDCAWILNGRTSEYALLFAICWRKGKNPLSPYRVVKLYLYWSILYALFKDLFLFLVWHMTNSS